MASWTEPPLDLDLPDPTPPREDPPVHPTPITTKGGTTVSLASNGVDVLVLLDHPDAPDDMRPTEAGRVTELGGFQPAMFAAFALSVETLRAIADLIERQAR